MSVETDPPAGVFAPPFHLPLDELSAEVVEFQNATGLVDEAAAAWLGINRSDLRCLSFLFFRGPMTAGELAEASALSPGAITSLADRLERAGYAVRLRDAADRRRVVLAVTAWVVQVSAQLYGPIADEGRIMYERYSPAEIAAIASFLRAGREMQWRQAARIRALPPRPPAPG